MPLNKFHINSITDSVITSKKHQVSNIQVYVCYAKRPLDKTLPKGAKTDPLVLAISTLGGSLIEVSLTNLLKAEEITLQYKVHFENHCNGTQPMTKELFSLHPSITILASISQDKTLKI